ncbi:hypothetical protein HAX54_036106 [Datura stramonium]|uniref:Uncharacterized protein n=1 Tax=Datura stramonium TaxID=4076 RepID=A0ABS8VGC5_DATST|nr:hypothetical protein [Datura stramonium]
MSWKGVERKARTTQSLDKLKPQPKAKLRLKHGGTLQHLDSSWTKQRVGETVRPATMGQTPIQEPAKGLRVPAPRLNTTRGNVSVHVRIAPLE